MNNFSAIFVNISEPSFGYNHPLKTAFIKGLMPEVKYGIYHKPLKKNNCSLEHITPKSQGGTLTWDNLFLADKFENSKRGTKPIEQFINKLDIFSYLLQFINVKNKYVDGLFYIKAILNRFNLSYDEFMKFKKRG